MEDFLISVDFATIDEKDHTLGRVAGLSDLSRFEVGQTVTVGDAEGNRCDAVVRSIQESGLIVVELRRETFRDGCEVEGREIVGV